MDKENIVKQTQEYVKSVLEGEGTGHDWWHIYRVWKNAVQIGKNENVDMFVVEISALLHDIGDHKFHGGDETVGPRLAREFLDRLNVENEVIDHVCQIIKDVSFKGAKVKTPMKSKEGMVVQDADRLDAIGAIGIARCFAYGGSKKRELYNPNIKPKEHESFNDYKKGEGTTLNHFYEKLLLLRHLMNTETAKKISQERHKFMEEFLDRFYKEWDGIDN